MWIMLNNAFLSIVENRNNKDELLVRARIEGDIERVFPEANSFQDEQADYKYRAFVLRKEVEKVIALKVSEINYENFKGSISPEDRSRHDAYLRVWSEMHKTQK